MLCAAESDPFEGPNYRLAAVIHESLLCPLLNKATVYAFKSKNSIQREFAVVIANSVQIRSASQLSIHDRHRREGDNWALTNNEVNSVGTQVRIRKRRSKVSESSNASDRKADHSHYESSDSTHTSKSPKKSKDHKSDRSNKSAQKSSTKSSRAQDASRSARTQDPTQAQASKLQSSSSLRDDRTPDDQKTSAASND